MEQPTDWVGLGAFITSSVAGFLSLAAFGVSTWNNRIAKATHILVNSNMDEFKKALIEAGILKVEAAVAKANIAGRQEERAERALRDEMPKGRFAAAVAPAPAPLGSLKEEVKVEVKELLSSGQIEGKISEGKISGTLELDKDKN